MLGVEGILNHKKADLDDYYKILGCGEDAKEDQIQAEYRVLALKFHPDKNPGDEIALELFQKLKEARDTLLDPEKKSKYDKWKRSEVCIPFQQWLGLGDRIQTTMHWAKPKGQTMLEQGPNSLKGNKTQGKTETDNKGEGNIKSTTAVTHPPATTEWRSDSSSAIYGKFRNYQI